MIVKKLIALVVICNFVLLIGCSKEQIEQISEIDEEIAIEVTKDVAEVEKKSLLTNPIPTYDPNEVITIEYKGKIYETTFFIPRLENFGLYLPTNMSTESYEDGDVVFFETERNHIVLQGNKFNFNEKTNRLISELTPYDEYKGSYDYAYAYKLTFSENPEIDDSDLNNSISNYFVFEHPTESVHLTFLYKVEDKDNVIPLFLEVLKTIRYVDVEGFHSHFSTGLSPNG